MKIQIVCRDAEEAKFCCDNGVDSIGLPVGQKHFSKDFISKTKAKAIIKLLPPFCTATMITHLESAQEIVDIAKFCGFSCIQLHSYISESEVKKIKAALPYVKILRLVHIDENGKILNKLSKNFIGDAIFTDSINLQTNQFGGTGKTHNFDCDAEIVKTANKPVMIAGGLNAQNVAQIIAKVKPWGVDSNSGCATNYKLDKQKTLAFINAVRATDACTLQKSSSTKYENRCQWKN